MALKIGNNAVANAFVGASQVRRAYKGGTLVYQAFSPASEQEFIQQEATGGPAQLLKVYGKSIVNNQLVQNSRFPSLTTPTGITWTNNGDGSFSLVGTASANTNITENVSRYSFGDHKYFLLCGAENVGFFLNGANSNVGSYTLNKQIVTANNDDVYVLCCRVANGASVNSNNFPLICVDLTLRFGAGNEPTTVDEALRLLGGDAFDPTYDPGSLQSNKTAELRAYDGGTLRGSLALNLSTLTGKLNGEGASVVVFPDGLRGVGSIRDEAEGSTGEVARAVVDLGTLNWTYVANKQVFTADSPNDSAEVVESYGISALCAKYSKTKADTLWGGQSPDKSFVMNGGFWTSGKRIGIKDTAYTDAATFKSAMSGVMLDYPLATPLTYTLDTPLPTDLTCEQGDILQRVSDNNCPFVGEMKFGL